MDIYGDQKYFWRQFFGICDKYEVNYTSNWSQNNTKMTVFGHLEPLNIVLDSQK